MDFYDPIIENPPYLQVWNSANELVGLMKGPVPETQLWRGYVVYLEVPDEKYNPTSVYDYVSPARYVRHDFQVAQYWVRRPDETIARSLQREEIYWALRSDLPLSVLRRIRQFR